MGGLASAALFRAKILFHHVRLGLRATRCAPGYHLEGFQPGTC